MTAPTEPKLTQDVYQALVENLDQAIFVKDRELRFTYVNPQFCQFVGRTSEDLIGQRDEDFFPAELAARYPKGDQQVIDTGKPLDTIEEFSAPDGTTRYIQVVKKPLRAGDEINAIQGIFWDVTSRILAEQNSKENQEHFYSFPAPPATPSGIGT